MNKVGIGMLFNLIERMPQAYKKIADAALDVIEDIVEKTPTKIDDTVVLPLAKATRAFFDIEDGDEDE